MNTVQPGDTVLLRYALFANGAPVVYTFDEPEAEQVTLGAGQFDAVLEAQLPGLAPHRRHSLALKPAEAYGLRDNDMIKSFARHTLPDAQNVVAESIVEFALEDGTPLPGVVIEVGPEDVVIDFNHPLAGMDIVFEVEIVAVLPRATH